jgi:hypothetical protein
MKLTEKEEKIARLALDKGAQDGERAAAALKLIESLHARGVSVEDIQGETAPDSAPDDETPRETPHEAAYRQAAARQEQAEYEERVRKEEARIEQAEREARAAQAAYDALSGYRKLAIGLGALLGPYSRFSWSRLFSAPRETTAEEAAINEIFAHVILALVELMLVIGIGAIFFH